MNDNTTPSADRLTTLETLLAALEASPEVRPGTGPALVAARDAEVRAATLLAALEAVAAEVAWYRNDPLFLKDGGDPRGPGLVAAESSLRLMASAGRVPVAARCSSCDHQAKFHDTDGRCWFTVDHGIPGSNLVCPCAPAREDTPAQPETAPEAERIVAYRSPGGRVLRCLTHAPRELIGTDFHPVTAADLPDGGICTHIDRRGNACGVDVLIAPGQSTAAPERPGKDTPAGGEFTRDDFFRPGRTYATRSGEQFHCEYMTCRPGARSLRSLRAVGWFGRGGSWSLRMFGDRSWAAGWSDITDEQQRGGGR